MSENVEAKLTEKALDEILEDILQKGLIFCAEKGHGKTDACKHIVRRFIKTRPDVRINIFDTCLNWRHTYDKIPYMEMRTVIDTVPDVPHIIVDVPFPSAHDTRTAISSAVIKDFNIKCELKKVSLDLPYWDLYVIEEIQNVFGSWAISGLEGEFWKKEVSEGRNWKQSYLGLGQRLADIDAKIVERCKGYMFGRLVGDNNMQKVRRIVGKNGNNVVEAIKVLGIGQFIFYSGDKVTQFNFPKWESTEKPYQYIEKLDASKITTKDLSWLLKR